MKNLLSYCLVAALSLWMGMLLSDTDIATVARDTANKARTAAVEVVGNSAGVKTRTMV